MQSMFYKPTKNLSRAKKNWRKPLRQLWLKLHLYLALTVGFVFVVLGLTGSINVFFFELEELGLPTITAESQVQPRSLDELFQVVQTAHPQKTKGWTLRLPDEGSDYLWAEYLKPDEKADLLYAPLRVLVDPYTGKIASESYWGDTLWTFIYEVHADFLTGFWNAKIGQLGFDVICFMGIFLLVSSLTGLYLWWPKGGKFKQALSFKKAASPERFYFDLHKITGFYSASVLIILALTGFSFGYKDYMEPVVRCFSSVRPDHLEEPALKSQVRGSVQTISIATAVSLSQAVFPDAVVREVQTPAHPDGVFKVSLWQIGEANHKSPRSKVWLDRYNGKLLAVQNPNQFSVGETFLNLMWPLHSGEAFGFIGRLVWCATGFAPLVLYVSGLIRWRQKCRAKKLNLIKNLQSH